MVNAILRLPAVKARTGLSKSTLYALMAEGRFPRAVRLGRRSVGWPSGEVEHWLRQRMEERGSRFELEMPHE